MTRAENVRKSAKFLDALASLSQYMEHFSRVATTDAADARGRCTQCGAADAAVNSRLTRDRPGGIARLRPLLAATIHGQDNGQGPRRAEQAPVQSSRVPKSQTAAEGSTSPGAGGARAPHEPSRRAAKTDSFPFRLSQYFPSEAVKLTNTQPGQARLANASNFIQVNRTGSLVE